jgi:GAF domain-containing protein/ActR/RegA family two-component response regulator
VRLLVVDDKEGFREQLEQIFAHEGFEVASVASGTEAVEALESFAPDIVLTDIVMPRGDGFFLLEQVQEKGYDCPVVVITAYGSQQSAVKALRLGAYDYITKPFDLDVILAVVHRAAEYRRLQLEVAQRREAQAAQLAELQRSHQEINALQDLAAAIQSSLELSKVLDRIVDGVVHGLGYRAAMVAVYDPGKDALVVESAVIDQQVWAEGEQLVGMSVIGSYLTMDRKENLAIRSAKQGEMSVTHHLHDLFRPAVDRETAQVLQQMAGVHTMATVPLRANGKLVGNFFAGTHREELDEADLLSLRAFARQAALAIEHAWLYEKESKSRRLSDMLHVISIIIGSTLDPEALQKLILEQSTKVFACDSCGMFLLRDGALELVAWRHQAGPAERPTADLKDTPPDLLDAALRERRALILSDVPGVTDWPATGQKVQSWIGVPLVTRDEVLGVLTFNSRAADAYDEKDTRYAWDFARQAAVALVNARLYAETEKNLREQEYLQEIGRAFNSTLDLEQVLRLVMAKTNELLGVEAGSVALLTEEGDELIFHASVGGGADAVQGWRMSVEKGIVGWVVRNGVSLLVPDVAQDPRHFSQVDDESGFKTRSILCVPLVSKGRVIGAIEVLNKIDGSFDDDDLRMTEALAFSAATAIENAQLFQREKQALEKLKQAQDELVRAQRMALLAQIGVTVRHEVNNPLTAVLGNADWLLQVLQDLEGEPRKALEAIRSNALRIRDIVNKLEAIRSDRVTEYVEGIEMIDLHQTDEGEPRGGARR